LLDFSGSSIIKKKPGKLAKLITKLPDRLRRQWWMFGSNHESFLVQQFGAACVVVYDNEDSDPEGYALHRYSYTHELKLAAVE